MMQAAEFYCLQNRIQFNFIQFQEEGINSKVSSANKFREILFSVVKLNTYKNVSAWRNGYILS